MTERLVGIDVKAEIAGSIARLEQVKPKLSDEAMKPKDKILYEAKVETALSEVLTRIVFARNFKDLGTILEGTIKEVNLGKMGARELDQVKAKLLDVAGELGEIEDEDLAHTLEALFKRGKYEEAAKALKQQINNPQVGFNQNEKQELFQFLDRVKDKRQMTEKECEVFSDELAQKYIVELHSRSESLAKKMYEKTDKLKELILSEEIKILKSNKNILSPEVEMKVTIPANKRGEQGTIWKEIENLPNMETRDKKFVRDLVGKVERFGSTDSASGSQMVNSERSWDFQSMGSKDVALVWMRTGEMLLKYKNELNNLPETKELLNKMYDGARARILSVSEDRSVRRIGENSPEPQISPEEMAEKRAKLPPQEELDFFADRRYQLNDEGVMGVDSILRLQRDRLKQKGVVDLDGDIRGRTASALEELRTRNPEVKKSLRHENGKWRWFGTDKEYFDLCREQIYEIQGTLTQENMGNLVFEESAQTYLALMRVDVGEKMELENAKDAITKMLYIDYAVKNMWKSGANVETWQRIAGLMTREREEGFFEIMNIGENLKVTDKEGKEHNYGRFTADDIMSLREMNVEGTDHTWKVELGSQSSARKMERMKDFTNALAMRMVDKREHMYLAGDQKNGLSPQQAQAERAKISAKEYSVNEKQRRWIMRYGDFLGGATLRDGEHGIDQSTKGEFIKVKDENGGEKILKHEKIVKQGKMELADHPLGEFAIKTGPWAVIYDYHYEVTKYGGDAVGSLFLPNVSMLSFARGETLAQFIKKDSNVKAGMMTSSGEYLETGTGAKEFFFNGQELDAVDNRGRAIRNEDGKQFKENELWTDFWGDVIFDTRTGNISKTAIHRTVDKIRKEGRKKLTEWDGEGKTGFVENLDFSKMEAMLGKAMGIDNFVIPGGDNKRNKFEWMVDHFDYTFWRKDTMKAKREGDWVNKYVAQKYVESYSLLQDFLNSPGLATKVAVRNKIGEYAGSSGMDEWNKRSQNLIDHNNRVWLTGPKTAPGSSNEAVWREDVGGDFYEVERVKHSPLEGAHPGSGLAFSIQQLKEGFKNPMYFEKTDINNAFHGGMIDRKTWGKEKWKWFAKAYLGQEYSLGKLKFRLGYIPLLTPFFLARGYWVDRLELDWESFKFAFSKNNEEFLEKAKKVFGIS